MKKKTETASSAAPVSNDDGKAVVTKKPQTVAEKGAGEAAPAKIPPKAGAVCPGKHEESKTCPTCRGMKKITCRKCHGEGHGTAECGKCKGTGVDLPCSSCRGTGRHPAHAGEYCAACRGSGSGLISGRAWQWFPGAPCPACKGHRFVQVECNYCKGKGREDCPKCDRKGYICATCDAEKSAAESAAEKLRGSISGKIGLLALSVICADSGNRLWVKGGIPEGKIDAFAKRYNGKGGRTTFDQNDLVAFLDCDGFFDSGVGVLLTKRSLFMTYPDSNRSGREVSVPALAGRARKKVGQPADGTSYFADGIDLPAGRPAAMETFMKGVWVAASAFRYFEETQVKGGRKVLNPEMETLLDTIRKGSCNGPKGPATPEPEPNPDEPDEPEATAQSKPRAMTESEEKWYASWSILVLLLILARGIDYFTAPEPEKRAAAETARPAVIVAPKAPVVTDPTSVQAAQQQEQASQAPDEAAIRPAAPDPAPVQIAPQQEQASLAPAESGAQSPVTAGLDDFPLLKQMMRVALEGDKAEFVRLIEQIRTMKPAAGNSEASEQLTKEALRLGEAGEYGDAITLFERANKANPANAEAVFMVAFFQGESGNFQAAEVKSLEALMIDPTRPLSWTMLGISMVKTGKTEWAVAAILNSILLWDLGEKENPLIARKTKDGLNPALRKVVIRATEKAARMK